MSLPLGERGRYVPSCCFSLCDVFAVVRSFAAFVVRVQEAILGRS